MDGARLLWSRTVCAVPWISLALVLAVAAVINHTVDVAGLQFDVGSLIAPGSDMDPAGDLPSASRHLFVRLAWGTTAMGFALVAIAALAMAIYVFWSCLRELPARERYVTSAIIVVMLVLLLTFSILAGDWVLSEPSVTTSLRKATMHRTAATHAVSVSTFFDAVSYVVFLSLVSAASATLISPRRSALSAASLSRRVSQLRAVLYVGAAALVLRALEMYCLYRWPGAWLEPTMAGLVDSIALALSTAHGAFFTAVLMSLYIPAAFILRFRANWLARHVVRGAAEERNAWLAKVGLGLSPFKELAGIFAAVAPLIAGGSVSKLIELLSG